MCTVSVIASGSGYRLVTNRDEQRTRPRAEAPAWRDDPVRAIWPRDPGGGGTWVAAAESGLTLCLLNVNIPPNGRAEPVRSRGGLIPALLDSRDPGEVMARVRGMDLSPYAPFRLVAVGPGPVVHDARWDGLALCVSEHLSGGAWRPVCWASSGLGDELVEPRLPLFEQVVCRDPTPAAQDAFHRHRWADRPEISVLMSRADARTVSIAAIEVGDGVEMSYEEIAEE